MPELGLRERKKLATRHAIELAAVELALEHGMDSLTVEAIADRADVTSRTFFNHFADKDDALMGMPRDSDFDDLILVDEDEAEDAPTALAYAARAVKAQLALFNSDLVQLDSKRRELIQLHPELLRREFQKLVTIETLLIERLTEWLIAKDVEAASLASRSGPVDPATALRPADHYRDEAQAVTYLIGAAVRLGMDRWSRASAEPSEFPDYFDSAVASILTLADDRSTR